MPFEIQPLSEQKSQEVTASAAYLRPLFKAFERSFMLQAEQPPSLGDLRDLAVLQDLFPPRHFQSHRPVIGWVIIYAKRLMTLVSNKFLAHGLFRQVELNQHTWQLAFTVFRLNQRLEELETKVAVLTLAQSAADLAPIETSKTHTTD